MRQTEGAERPDKPVYVPNPPKNQKWRIGRVQRQIARAFISNPGIPLSTAQLIRYCYPRLKCGHFESWRYRQVREAAARFAVRVGVARHRGEPVLWKPRG